MLGVSSALQLNTELCTLKTPSVQILPTYSGVCSLGCLESYGLASLRIRIHLFLLCDFNKRTQKRKGRKGTTGENGGHMSAKPSEQICSTTHP